MGFVEARIVVQATLDEELHLTQILYAVQPFDNIRTIVVCGMLSILPLISL